MVDELVFDAWTPLSFKRTLGNNRVNGPGWQPPAWTGDHSRRLQAYRILTSYVDNASREYLGTEDQAKKDTHREYGDAGLIAQTIVAALLGDEQSIAVEGAEDFGDTEQQATAADGENDTGQEDFAAASELQDWYRQWATEERLSIKMLEGERNSVILGDGVYTLGWSSAKDRPRLRVFDPSFYFPVLSDGNEDDYPERVHIAWEVESTDIERVAAGGTRRVRRITWELREREEGTTTYPYADGPSTKTCYFTDAVWVIDANSSAATIDDFAGSARPEYMLADDGTELDNIDLGIDFIPVVHVPNTVSLLHHYGRSSLSPVLQLLSDLSAADTDLQASSATTGKPPIALSGASMDKDTKLSYQAGELWELGPDGKLTALDTSQQLQALMEYTTTLLERLSVNARVPAAVMGRVKPNEVPSGVALALSFGPLEAVVKEMRLVRDEKYTLLLKFAWRMAVAAGAKDVPKRYFNTQVLFGSYLPADQAGAVALVDKALTVKAISLETAVLILVQAGLPIEDAQREVQRIEERDFKGANELLDATGKPENVVEYLGTRFQQADLAPPAGAAQRGIEVQPPEIPAPTGVLGPPANDQPVVGA